MFWAEADEARKAAVMAAAQAVLDARAKYPGSTLAGFYVSVAPPSVPVSTTPKIKVVLVAFRAFIASVIQEMILPSYSDAINHF